MRELYSFEVFISVLEAEPHVRGIALHVRAVWDNSSKMRFLAHFLHFLFLSSSPLFHVRNPSSQKLDFLYFYQQIHHGSCIKDGEQERVNISNRLKFEFLEDSSQSLLLCLILEDGVLNPFQYLHSWMVLWNFVYILTKSIVLSILCPTLVLRV